MDLKEEEEEEDNFEGYGNGYATTTLFPEKL